MAIFTPTKFSYVTKIIILYVVMKKQEKRGIEDPKNRFSELRKVLGKEFKSSFFSVPLEVPMYRDVLFAEEMTVQFRGLLSKWRKLVVIITQNELLIQKSVENGLDTQVLNYPRNLRSFFVKINKKNPMLFQLTAYGKDIYVCCESEFQRMYLLALFGCLECELHYSSLLYHTGTSRPFKDGIIPEDSIPSICTTHISNWSERQTCEFLSIYSFDLLPHTDRIPRILHRLKGLKGKDLLELIPPRSHPLYEDEDDFVNNMYSFESSSVFSRLRTWVDTLRSTNYDFGKFIVFLKLRNWYNKHYNRQEFVNIRNTPSRLQNLSQIITSLSNEDAFRRYFWKEAVDLKKVDDSTDYESRDSNNNSPFLSSLASYSKRRKNNNPRESLKRFSENFELVKKYLDRGIDVMKKEIVSFSGILWWNNRKKKGGRRRRNVQYKFYEKYVLVFCTEKEGTSFALEWRDILEVKKINFSAERHHDHQDGEFFKKYTVYEVHIKNNQNLRTHHKSKEPIIQEYWAVENSKNTIKEFENRLKIPIMRYNKEYEEERDDLELRILLTEISSEGLFSSKGNLNIFRRPILDEPFFDGAYIRHGDIYIHLIISIKCCLPSDDDDNDIQRNRETTTGWFLDFGGATNLVFPVTYDKEMLYVHDKLEGLVVKHRFQNTSLQDLQRRISRVCARWNSSMIHPNMKQHLQPIVGTSCRLGNRSDFIVDVMKELNLPNPFTPILRLFSKKKRQKQENNIVQRSCFRKLVYQTVKSTSCRVKLTFTPSREFFDTFRLSDFRGGAAYYGRDYYLYNHFEVDEFLYRIHEEVRNGATLVKKYEEYEVLKLFDRCFWVRLKKYEFDALRNNNNNNNNNNRSARAQPSTDVDCILGDPTL